MAALDTYSNLTKSHENILKKGYCFSELFSLSVYLKSPNAISLKNTFKQLLDNNHKLYNASFANINYESQNFSLNQELSTDTSFKTIVKTDFWYLKNLKVGAEYEKKNICPSENFLVSLEHTHPKSISKIILNKSKTIEVNSLFPINSNFAFGFHLKFNDFLRNLSELNTAVRISSSNYSLVLHHFNLNPNYFNFTNFSMNFLWNPRKNLFLAGETIYDNTKNLNVKIGVLYKYNEENKFRAKIDNEGVVGICAKRKINNKVEVVTGTQFSVFDTPIPHLQFGFRLKLNH